MGLLFAPACGDERDDGSEHSHEAAYPDYTEARETLTVDDTFYVRYEADPDPIPVDELFELKVWVYESSDMTSQVEASDLAVEADMPSHDHGMMTDPEIVKDEPGIFTVNGMKFHMASSPRDPWVIRLTVYHEGTSDVAKFKVIQKEAE